MNIRAFVSYADVTEAADVGWVGRLCKLLEQEVRLMTGLTLTILHDKQDIKWGEQWHDFVENGPKSAKFLIPILTMPYFTSVPCLEEYEAFLMVEKEQSRNDLILPILYVDVSARLWNADPRIERWKNDLLRRQSVNLINLRHSPITNSDFRTAISSMAAQFKSRIEKMKIEDFDVAAFDDAKVGLNPVRIDAKNLAPEQRFPEVTDSGGPFKERVRLEEFRKLSGSQKDLLRYVYRQMYRSEISVEELYHKMYEKYGDKKFQTDDEVYYRLRVLESSGLLKLKSMGRRATNVVRDEVMERLITVENLFPT